VFKDKPDNDESVGVSGTRKKWKVTAALAAAGTIAAAVMVVRFAGSDRPEGNEAQSTGAPRFQHGQPYPEVAAGAGDISPQQQIQNVVEVWRQAIKNKQAEQVLECDRIFQDAPTKFSDPLRYLAKNDREDRVRAFSTRVLGKFKDPANAELFRELLKDPHQYVRSNAAWGLSQLGGDSNLALVDEIRRRDREEYVRNAAAEALRGAGSKPRGR
jgi:hypothetical protein